MTMLCSIKNGGFKTASGSIIIFMAILLLIPAAALCSPKKLMDDSEYSDKEFRKCIIKDYADMVDGDDIRWVWTDPNVKLSL